MYYDELFEKALNETKEENFLKLKLEVKRLEKNFEKFLEKFFNSTTHNVEQNYHVTAM